MMLSLDNRNFHGWGYRREVVAEIEKLSATSLVEQEFAYTTSMIQRALQNFSALHYRFGLMTKLLDERNADPQARRKMLEEELDFMQNALVDPWNQSAWFYHQYLMSAIVEKLWVPDLTDEEIRGYLRQEMERIGEILEDVGDCKWVYQALVEYSLQYGEWIETDEKDVEMWRAELRELDPLRKGRWEQ